MFSRYKLPGMTMVRAITLALATAAMLVNAAPSSMYASIAGDVAEKLCESLADTVVSSTGLKINNTFSQYFPEGSMPSLELLTKLYPNGTIPKDVNVASILDSVGPDIDIKSDAGYGRANGRAAQNGPTGSMPAFCRYGAYIQTSPLTLALAEVWLPLASDPSIPLIPANTTDFPTNSTAYDINADGSFVHAPSYYLKGQFKLQTPAPGSQNPPAPNDVPVEKKTNDTTKPPKDDTTKSGTGDKTQPSSSSTTYTQLTSDLGVTTKRGLEDDKHHDGLFDKRLNKHHHPKHPTVRHRLTGEEVLGAADGWNGRLVLMGNGGQRGFVPLRDLKQLVARYQFAVAGTNLGHYSGTAGVTWVNGTQFDDTILDWASRANHVTLQLAEDVLNAFYGPTAGVRVASEGNRIRRYYFGSSVGAARGLSAVQVYPQDYHGVLLGPPAQNFMNMNVGQIHISSVHNKTVVGDDGWFTQNSLYGPIKDVVTRQCDALDGVTDGIISNPFDCHPDLAKDMLCGTDTLYGKSNGTCLTAKQIDSANELYKPTYIDGQFVYQAFTPGLEDSASSMTGSNNKASGWHQLVVLKYDKLNKSFNPFTDIHYADLQRGNAEDPGKANAVQTDLSAFVQAGGKMMMYHGTYDLVISPLATIDYFESAVKDTSSIVGQDTCNDALKFYLVPGMRHSRGGPGAWHFGGSTQGSPGNRPYTYDTQHDMTLALIAWVEQGHEPTGQIAARYTQREALMPARPVSLKETPPQDLDLPDTQQNYNWGLVNTRLLCPWPKQAKYDGASNTDGAAGWKAFSCA